ncbi:hypothetical protein Turpa_3546 [Turneriella parva DSM 21527]|uniref:Uncharacterized protein n=1 Tax=Turneriella parva (strain ATCC BAA-1111 / DSM 21527 / NCTC 11395 / H) TaxID=869212 RepID=I4BA74_TURPD|nr:hypothetical protein Turpa_3546 [Turneriella parva DSM 21527]
MVVIVLGSTRCAVATEAVRSYLVGMGELPVHTLYHSLAVFGEVLKLIIINMIIIIGFSVLFIQRLRELRWDRKVAKQKR